MSNRDEERVCIRPLPEGLTVEIRPVARTARGRAGLTAASVIVMAAALYGTAHLGDAWEAGLKSGRFSEPPLGILAVLSLAVAVCTPLAFVGIFALAFAEETIVVGPEALVIETSALEKRRVRRIELEKLHCWRETYLPLAPWWTWAVKRLAACLGDRLEPVAGSASPKDKRRIGLALAQATRKPLLDDFGRTIRSSRR
jgi:hypothetical protein